jgi:exopolyphosphatase/guanosine-5'-triphosphate,3'-diphosphate pyrophosphatase
MSGWIALTRGPYAYGPGAATRPKTSEPRANGIVAPMRVGVVDLGTNSTRLLVADVDGGRVRELERRLEITRLGEAVDERRKLLPTALARVRNVLVDYRRAAEAAGAERTLALATSAVRDAENGEAFLGEIEWSYGFATRLLSGDEEALLTYRGVAAGRPLREGTVVLDVGGGSSEVIVGGPHGVTFHESFDLGCVRLTERFLHDDPPTEAQLRACRGAVRSLLGARIPDAITPREAIGVAGTVTTLATLHLGLEEEDPERIHGHRTPAAWIEDELARLSALTVAEIAALPGVHRDRAPVLVGGVVAVAEALAFFGLPELEASEQDILHGGALAAAELPAIAEGAAPPGAFTCC